MTTIPASQIVAVNPGVISSGGSPLALNGVILSPNTLIPTGSVQPFNSAASVSDFFGPSSTEYALAQTYFMGNDNSTIKPNTLFFAPYNAANVAAWLQSGSFAGVTLAQLTALTAGTLIATVDGTAFTSATINLSGAASFTAAAGLITSAFTGTGHPVCTWDAVNSTFVLTSSTTGATSTMTYATGTMATELLFTSATGAILSQGAVADTPATAMANVVANTQNWAAFMTLVEPDLAHKFLYAAWVNAQNNRYLYIEWDTDAQAIVANATEPFGVVVKADAYNGVLATYNTAALAAFVLGLIACINFSERNGRITAAFKTQSGFNPTVTNSQIATNLLANGYSFYGAYATANDEFNFFYNGQMPGEWKWLDTYVNKIYLNAQFQLALLELLTNVGSIPYTPSGYSLIRAAMTDPIQQALNFGAIRAGVVLSAAQIAEVNNAAGQKVDDIIANQGYYLQILDPGAQVRGNRGTPVINFWYTDGGAVQQITLASIDIE